MKIRRKRSSLLVGVVLASTALSGAAHGQARLFDFTDPFDSSLTHKYGLLNGDNLALYINDRGDLGAPYRFDGTKPAGLATGKIPFINADGSVMLNVPIGGSTVENGTYGALFSRTPTAGIGDKTVGASVRAKQEYFTVGPTARGATEGFSIIGDSPLLNNRGNWVPNSSLLFQVNSFSASGDSATGALKAISGLSLGPLEVTQDVTFQTSDLQRNRAKFTVSLKNTSAETLTGVQYARAIDPNQGYTEGTTSTVQRFRTPTEEDAFALDSLDSPSVLEPRHLAIGVLPGDPGVNGAMLFSRTFSNEFSLLSNPLTDSVNRVLLNGNGAQYFLGGQTDPVRVTDNFLTDAAFNSAIDFAQGDVALMLLSPEFDIAPGDTEQFIFYYFFDPLAVTPPPPGVPEPGTVALLLGGLLGSGLAARHRTRRG